MDVGPTQIDQFFYIWSPLFLVLWLLPWFCIAVWIDNGWPRRFTLASLLLGVAICSLEMAAMSWFGPMPIVPGIIFAGVIVFLPTILVRLFRRYIRPARQRPVLAEVVPSEFVDESQ